MRGKLAIILGSLCLGTLAQAQPSPSSSIPIFENVTLSPNFSPDPLTVRGLSGGSVASEKTAGRAETPTGPCVGYVDEQPDHTLVLTGFFQYLSLQVKSNADTVLVVRGPGGSWCNDDYTDRNPGIVGQWLSGTYEIWVGSYKPNTYNPYVIKISDNSQP
ncbi:MAG: hypothetical protein HC835_17730 [Oscillatoriales cyanobacterium RM2_1_1]|nr:hypothetical protein [Oscillatoriales cyanobacterium SM2_3_0]NJO47301.1 hypothetical protein [Oscillatoriales cyanobacterium RM2_1_1]